MSDMAMLRIGILIAGVILLATIFFFGRPKKPSQGRRLEPGERDNTRVEPSLATDDEIERADYSGDEVSQPELGLGAAAVESDLGKRPNQDFDKIVSLYVAAKAGNTLRGEDIVVAAEKTGLTFGHMNVFHRLIDNKPELGPVFSMANILQPGSFDMANIRELETPAIAFFLTLPAPITALEAWEKLLPNVERMAELLDGVVLDDSRNTLGRQRIQHIREELRGYDRQHEAPPLTKAPRW
ncbi:cell division protein ZipA [Pseudoxanthomonas dokdonensis]|uniref:Cell division protein ZipA n=1 Tax=Pseudoxanthomonas dokdonensis TaxID=344882 RepID=A0A0R0CHB5_9GAMM|nr:cell division protein ZipA [Pseudoxanthomonas dokdonensis]KRG68763.1 cell division protein ZipA [Pseudoxanthomonas dokdonensis]